MILFYRLAARWATLTGNPIQALHLRKLILMVDFTAFDVALAAAQARVASDNASAKTNADALAKLQDGATADQAHIDQAAAALTSLANGQ